MLVTTGGNDVEKQYNMEDTREHARRHVTC